MSSIKFVSARYLLVHSMLNVALRFVHLNLHRKGSCTALEVQGRFVVRVKFLFFAGVTVLFAVCLDLNAATDAQVGLYPCKEGGDNANQVFATRSSGYRTFD